MLWNGSSMQASRSRMMFSPFFSYFGNRHLLVLWSFCYSIHNMDNSDFNSLLCLFLWNISLLLLFGQEAHTAPQQQDNSRRNCSSCIPARSSKTGKNRTEFDCSRWRIIWGKPSRRPGKAPAPHTEQDPRCCPSPALGGAPPWGLLPSRAAQGHTREWSLWDTPSCCFQSQHKHGVKQGGLQVIPWRNYSCIIGDPLLFGVLQLGCCPHIVVCWNGQKFCCWRWTGFQDGQKRVVWQSVWQ